MAVSPISFILQWRSNGKIVDPFTFIREELDIPKRLWKRYGISSFLGTGAEIFVAPGAYSEERFKFAIDMNALQQGVDMKVYAAGMKELERILGSPSKLQDLAYKAYTQGVVPEFKKYVPITVERRGKGSGHDENVNVEVSKSGKIRTKSAKAFRKIKKPYEKIWSDLVRDVIWGKPSKVSGGVLSFGFKDLLKYKVESQTSSFTSIFLMEEFGTGLNVDEALLREYVGSGKMATPWKVPPQMAALFGHPEAVGMWWPFPSLRTFAYKMYAYALAQEESTINQAFRMHGMRTALKYKNKAVSLNEFRKYAARKLRERTKAGGEIDPIQFAYGSKGGIGFLGRPARHLFFDRQGVVKRIRDIQEIGYRTLFQLLDKEIEAKVKGFPSLFKIVFGF